MERSNGVSWEDSVSALDGLIKTGIIHNLEHTELERFLEEAKDIFERKIQIYLKKHDLLKINSSLKYEIMAADKQKPTTYYLPVRCKKIRPQESIRQWWQSKIATSLQNRMQPIYDDAIYDSIKIVNLKFNIHIVPINVSPPTRRTTPKKVDQFRNFNNKQKMPFVMYATFINAHDEEDQTSERQNNAPGMIAYYLKCSYDDSLSFYKTHEFGENCIEWFAEELKTLCKDFKYKLDTYCDIVIPIVLPTLTKEMGNFIIKKFNEMLKCNFNVIVERYIDRYVSIKMNITDDNNVTKFRFISYSKLLGIKNGETDNCLLKEFLKLSSDMPDVLLTKKKKDLVHPCNFLNSCQAFSNPLEFNKQIEIDSNNLTRRICNHYNINTLEEYTKFYVKKEIEFIMEMFEKFRNKLIDTYSLDAANYYTLTGFAWDAMLLKTKVAIELPDTNDAKFQFIMKTMRGGFNQVVKRRCSANNKYLPTYDPSQESRQLIELDMNNLSGWGMSQYLPLGNFQWNDTWVRMNIESAQREIMKIPNNSPVGYVLQVDLEYPQELHDIHRDFPFCLEKIQLACSNEKMLFATLYDKQSRDEYDFVLHYRNLKQALEFGLKLKKVHKVVEFEQTPWLKEFIEMNTIKRQASPDKFEQKVFKNISNLIHGKSWEDAETHVTVRFINSRNLGEEMIAMPNFNGSKIFSENLVAMEFRYAETVLRKPRYLGVIISDLNKTAMYDFHYGYLKKIYGDNIRIVYSNTDGFIYELKHHDFYDLIKSDCHQHFDTSNYSLGNAFGIPIVNKFSVGMMKDVNPELFMTEFVGLNSTTYACKFRDRFGYETSPKIVGNNQEKLKFKDYEDCLDKFTNLPKEEQKKFQYLYGITALDNKRRLLQNSHETLPWGYYEPHKSNK